MTSDKTSQADFAARRALARQALSAIDPFLNGEPQPDPFRVAWFHAVYDLAGDDPAKVPWADLAPHPLTGQWIAAQGETLRGLAALDVGCGLGDNAEALSEAGCRVTAFDLAPRAIEWARTRFPASTVDYRTGDLFHPPAPWRGAFDLVHECYTLQALPADLIPAAAAAIAEMLRPGGRVLVVARARDEDAPADGPPWPLTRSNLDAFSIAGLREASIGDVPPEGDMVRHWRAVFEKSACD